MKRGRYANEEERVGSLVKGVDRISKDEMVKRQFERSDRRRDGKTM